MLTSGEDMYPDKPRPWTVEAKCVELTYEEDPRPWTVEASAFPIELKYPAVPRPCTVETREEELM
jgi:hypothetical protein